MPALVRIGEEVRLLRDGPSTVGAQPWLMSSSHGEEGGAHAHVHVHVWRTFMPPRHLLALPLPAADGPSSTPTAVDVNVHDHSSSRPADLLDGMLSWHEDTGGVQAKEPQHLLIAPSWALHPLLDTPSPLISSPGSNSTSMKASPQADCQLELDFEEPKRYYSPQVERLASFAPHLDADHMGEMWEVGVRRYEEARRHRDLQAGTLAVASAAIDAAREALALNVVRVSFDEVPRPAHEDSAGF